MMSVDRDVVWNYVFDYLVEADLDVSDYDVSGLAEEMADFMEANDIGCCDEFPRDILDEMVGAYEIW